MLFLARLGRAGSQGMCGSEPRLRGSVAPVQMELRHETGTETAREAAAVMTGRREKTGGLTKSKGEAYLRGELSSLALSLSLSR